MKISKYLFLLLCFGSLIGCNKSIKSSENSLNNSNNYFEETDSSEFSLI